MESLNTIQTILNQGNHKKSSQTNTVMSWKARGSQMCCSQLLGLGGCNKWRNIIHPRYFASRNADTYLSPIEGELQLGLEIFLFILVTWWRTDNENQNILSETLRYRFLFLIRDEENKNSEGLSQKACYIFKGITVIRFPILLLNLSFS